MWYITALLSALFASVRRTNEKQLTQKLNHFSIGWSSQALSLPVLLAAVLWSHSLFNPLCLGPRFWIPNLILWIGFYPLNTFLYVTALKHGELSKILPLQALGPIFALLLGRLFLSQTASLIALASIALTVAGLYILNLKGDGWQNPLQLFTKDRANLFTLLSILLVSIVGIADTFGIKASSPSYFSLISTLGAVPVLYLSARLSAVHEFTVIKANFKQLAITGLLFGGTYVTYTMALATGPFAYVTAIRCSSGILGAVIGIIFLKESLTMHKVIALLLVSIGIIVLATQ